MFTLILKLNRRQQTVVTIEHAADLECNEKTNQRLGLSLINGCLVSYDRNRKTNQIV